MNLEYPGSELVSINPNTPPGSKPLIRSKPIMKADELTYLLWDVADIDVQQQFLLDFGMLNASKTSDGLLMKTYGTSPYVYVGRKAEKHRFVGMGFTALTREDLANLAAQSGAKVESLNRIGGGEVVRLTDPNGIVIEVTHGISPVESIPTRADALPVNTPEQKVRVNRGQRPKLMPAPVMKLGHCVTAANNMVEVCEWYMHHLGLIPSDVLCLDDASPIVAFMRLDRGDKPSDHHCVVVGKGAGKGYLHSAYEVVDLDAIAQGQQYLKNKRYKHVWGIGRHLLGSQLFDYFNDPAGCEFEHYADGDVYTSDHPTSYHPMDPGNTYSWGPDMPKEMLKPTFKQIVAILKGVFDGAVTLKWLKLATKVTSRSPRPWM